MKTQLSEQHEQDLKNLVRRVRDIATYRAHLGRAIIAFPEYRDGVALPHGAIEYATVDHQRVGRAVYPGQPDYPWRRFKDQSSDLYADLAEGLEKCLPSTETHRYRCGDGIESFTFDNYGGFTTKAAGCDITIRHDWKGRARNGGVAFDCVTLSDVKTGAPSFIFQL